MIELDRARAVRVDALVLNAVDAHAARILRQRIVEQRARRVQRAVEELDRVRLRNHRRTLGHDRGNPRRVIAVRMAVPHVADLLAGELALDLVDVELRARLVLARLEHHDVVVELGDDRVVAARPRRVAPEPWGELLLRERERRRLTAAAGRRLPGDRPPAVAGCGASAARFCGLPVAFVTSTWKNGQPPRVCSIFVGTIAPPNER